MNKMNWSKRELILGAAVLFVLLLLALSWFKPFSKAAQPDEDSLAWEEAKEPEETAKSEEGDPKSSEAKEAQAIVVDVKGAVRSSGVYEMEAGQRVEDVIKEAGGFRKKADKKQINLAEQVRDEMVIYVPKKGEDVKTVADGGSGKDSGSDQGGEKISLNAAEASDLEEISGIGPATAKAILDYREEHGPFKKIEDLTEVSGIGEKTMEKLKKELRL